MTSSSPSKPLTLSIDSIFVGKDFRSESFSQPRWWDSGSCYTALVKNVRRDPAPDSGGDSKKEKEEKYVSTRDLIWHDVSNGSSETYVSSDLLIPPGHDGPLHVDDYALSPDKSRLLIFTNSQKVWRKKTRGDYWVLVSVLGVCVISSYIVILLTISSSIFIQDITARDLRQLGGQTTKPSSLMFATFSPCGNKVAYIKANNLYVQDVHTFKITALTTDGSPTIINGTFDWVYEEEFRLRKGFRWSPDSKSIAFWQMDQSGVRVVNLINNTDHLYPQLVPIPYPKAGEQNPAVRIGVVTLTEEESEGSSAATSTTSAQSNVKSKIHWIHLPGDPRNHYIASLDWIPNSKELVFQRLNRLQNTVHVIVAELETGNIRVAFTGENHCAFVCDFLHNNSSQLLLMHALPRSRRSMDRSTKCRVVR
jgi:dipeptidyl-peptidase-4